MTRHSYRRCLAVPSYTGCSKFVRIKPCEPWETDLYSHDLHSSFFIIFKILSPRQAHRFCNPVKALQEFSRLM